MDFRKFPKGSKWSCTKGKCKDCLCQDLVFIPEGDEGIIGYCSECIKNHIK